MPVQFIKYLRRRCFRMKDYLLNTYRKLPLGFRKKVKNLLKHDEATEELSSREKVLKKLKKYDVVSFDIFDTLVTRCVYEPDDVFKILNDYLHDPDFFEKRKIAEQNAREYLKHDVNLDEIYLQYSKNNNLSLSETNKIKNAEISLENELLVARKEMLDILKELKHLNKKVILVSDMYLSKNIISNILCKCGYQDLYDELYVSNEINKRKDSKTIWPLIKEKYFNKKIIHLGDNDISDVLYPKEFGISTIKVYSSKELLQKSSLYPSLEEYINKRTCSDSLYLGLLFNNKIFNSPFSSLSIESFEDFSYMFHAPIITEFLKFVVDSDKDNLLFLAREGYYFTKLYNKYCNINKITKKNYYYFLASRKATNTASISSEEDVFALLKNEYVGTIKKFLIKNFNFTLNDADFEIKLPDDYDKVSEIVKKHLKEIKNGIKNENHCYKQYIKELIPKYKTTELNVIDLGYSGSIQYNLSKMLNRGLNGYYLTNSNSVKKYSNDNNLYFYFDIAESEEYQKIYHYSLILEYFLTAPYGQLQYFKEKNNKVVPVYNNESLDAKKARNLEIIYGEIIEYFTDIKKFGKYIDYRPSKGLLCRNYVATVESGIISQKVKDEFSFTDAYCSEEEKNVFKIISRY